MADAPLNYPPLPKHLMFVDQSDDNTFGEMAEHAWSSDFADELRLNAPMFTAGQMRAYVDADRAARATPSPPVAAPPATPVIWGIWNSHGFYDWQLGEASAKDWCAHFSKHEVDPLKTYTCAPLYAQPQPQPAQPLTDEALQKRAACGPVHCENGVVTRGPVEYRRELEARFERGWRAAEKHFGITAPSTPTPPEVAP